MDASRHVLVSCIMPTRDRRRFVEQSVRYFLRQDYAPAELVVVDDGSDSVSDLCGNDPRIRYLQLDQRQTIGAKRNLGCECASGEVILHWDDDDWYSRRRISYQVGELLQRGAEVCGLARV